MDLKKYSKTSLFLQLAIFLLIIGFSLWVYLELAEEGMKYEWQWNRLWRHFGHWTSTGFVAGPLLKGLLLTIAITVLCVPLSCCIGMLLAIMRLSPWKFCEFLSIIHITIWRGTPLLLQLFFVYFLIAPILNIGPLITAIITLSFFEGAYIAEIMRIALASVPREQWEASLSLGFSFRQSLWYVILPQAVKNALPALNNQSVSLVKDSTLVSAIAVADLTMKAQALIAETFLVFEVWLAVGLIYVVIAMCAALPGIWLEKRFNWH